MARTDNNKLGWRIESVMRHLSLNQAGLCRRWGVEQSIISKVRSSPNVNLAARSLQCIHNNDSDLNLHWLLTGNGQMYLPPKEVEESRNVLSLNKHREKKSGPGALAQ